VRAANPCPPLSCLRAAELAYAIKPRVRAACRDLASDAGGLGAAPERGSGGEEPPVSDRVEMASSSLPGRKAGRAGAMFTELFQVIHSPAPGMTAGMGLSRPAAISREVRVGGLGAAPIRYMLSKTRPRT
jgi:hypothetical protein